MPINRQAMIKAYPFSSPSRGGEKPDSGVDIMVLLDKSQPVGMIFWNVE